MRKILTVHYSQSGQLTEIISNFCSSIKEAEFEHVIIQPKQDFPFPWTSDVFFDIMPDCVHENQIELESIQYKSDQYDLIILGHQPWFLSPSLPVTSILKNNRFMGIMKGTPIITLIGSRNMWLNAQESIKKLIQDGGGKLIGNIALSDKTPNLISVLTIFHWMLKGKKTKKWGFFPLPGLAQEDIDGVTKFGALISEKSDFELLKIQEEFIKLGGVPVPTNILFIEGKAKKIFRIWANLITSKVKNGGKRSFWISFFKYYLLFVLFIISPILLFLYFVLVFPFTQSALKRKKVYFQGVTLDL